MITKKINIHFILLYVKNKIEHTFYLYNQKNNKPIGSNLIFDTGNNVVQNCIYMHLLINKVSVIKNNN